MKIHIVGEEYREISENLQDTESEIILCSLYNKRRISTKLHLFFDKERLLILAVLSNDWRIKEIALSDKLKRSVYHHLYAKKNVNVECDFMHKWEFLDSNTVCYPRTHNEEVELTKLLLSKRLI